MTDQISVDRILDILDTGLQTPVPDPTFGECSPVNDARCWRCQRGAPVDGSAVGVCEHCRRVLLDETPPAVSHDLNGGSPEGPYRFCRSCVTYAPPR